MRGQAHGYTRSLCAQERTDEGDLDEPQGFGHAGGRLTHLRSLVRGDAAEEDFFKRAIAPFFYVFVDLVHHRI